MENKRTKVLIIDDDNALLESTSAVLELEGFEVLTSLTGEKGLEILIAEFPNIVLLDINLPDTDGFTICKKMRKIPETANIPVIMITGDKTVDIDKSFSVGADDCIIKPIDFSYLISRIIKMSGIREKILVIEDDRHICGILKNILTGQRYEVEISHEGTDIFGKINKIKPDIVLLDISLKVPPHGNEICKLLKKNSETKNIPIVMLTANDDTSSVEECFEYGVDDYLFKPFNIPDLLLKVRKYLALSKKK